MALWRKDSTTRVQKHLAIATSVASFRLLCANGIAFSELNGIAYHKLNGRSRNTCNTFAQSGLHASECVACKTVHFAKSVKIVLEIWP